MIRPIGDAIGDAIAHSAHLRQLKQNFPNLITGIFATNRNIDVFKASQVADYLLSDNAEIYLEQRGKWDLLIDFADNFNADILLRDLSLNCPVMVITRQPTDHFPSLKDVYFYPPQSETHIRHYLQQSPLGKSLKQPAYFYLPRQQAQIEKMATHWQPQKLRILISPIGSTHYLNIDELAHFLIALAPNWANKVDWLMSNAHSASQYFLQLQSLCPSIPLRLSPELALEDYMQFVASADFVITLDSGTVHLATAYCRPLLAFYAQFPYGLHLWHPSPINHTPTMMLVSRQSSLNRNYIADYDLTEAIEWTNQILSTLKPALI